MSRGDAARRAKRIRFGVGSGRGTTTNDALQASTGVRAALALPVEVPPETWTPAEQALLDALRRREALYRRSLAVADVASAALALVVGLAVLGDGDLRPAAFAALPAVILVAKVVGLYDRDELVLHKTTLDEAPALFQVATLYALLFSLADGILVAADLGNEEIVAVWLLLFVSSLAARALARRTVRSHVPVERCLVLGHVDDAQRLLERLRTHEDINAVVVAALSLEEACGDGAQGLAAQTEALRRLVQEHQIHRVVIAPPPGGSEQTLDAVVTARALGLQVSVLPGMFEAVGASVERDQIYGLTLLGVRRFELTRSSQMIKRAFDLVAATVGLVLLAPLLLVLALMVKRSSPGPVLFRQRRIGRDGRPFEMLKFRTMLDGADEQKATLSELNEAAEGLFKIARDPRLTPAGRTLRRMCLDELPQLINVIRGEMSLVGPRPLVEEEDRLIEGRHRRRLRLKPGITGNWQIFGSSRIGLSEMTVIDALYAADWSLWGDIKILCRTFAYITARHGL